MDTSPTLILNTLTPTLRVTQVQSSSLIWRWLTALAVFGMIFLNYYANTHPFNGQRMGDVSAKYPTPLTPAGYTFAIWGLIFLGLAIYAIWQLLPSQRNLALPDAVAPPLTIAALATGAWVVLFAYEQILLSVVTMLVILGGLILAYGRARELVRAGEAPSWVSIPLALFLGWISVATVLNVTLGLQEVTAPVDGTMQELLTYLLLAVITGLGLLLSRIFQERTFPLVVAWALTGIWMAHLRENPNVGWTALGAAVLVLVLGLVLAQQGRKLQPWQLTQLAAEKANAQISNGRQVVQ